MTMSYKINWSNFEIIKITVSDDFGFFPWFYFSNNAYQISCCFFEIYKPKTKQQKQVWIQMMCFRRESNGNVVQNTNNQIRK